MLIQETQPATTLPQMITGISCIAAALGGYVFRMKSSQPATKMGSLVMFGLLFFGAYLIGAHAIIDPLVDKILGAIRGS